MIFVGTVVWTVYSAGFNGQVLSYCLLGMLFTSEYLHTRKKIPVETMELHTAEADFSRGGEL